MAVIPMLDLPEQGLYRTTQALPGNEEAFPTDVLVFVGERPDGSRFIVRPGRVEKNRWLWGEPTTPLRSPTWGKTLKRLPPEGYYTLPQELSFEGGGRWLKNAIVQLGYNGSGRGIIFVAEYNRKESDNILRFSDRGMMADDSLLDRLIWAPILPVGESTDS